MNCFLSISIPLISKNFNFDFPLFLYDTWLLVIFHTISVYRNLPNLSIAVKCRGREYLRIIYGAEYLEPDHLKRLKVRSLNRKRTLALKEFSLGMESLVRFVRCEPLYRVHECSFGVLALESEPVDPRL